MVHRVAYAAKNEEDLGIKSEREKKETFNDIVGEKRFQ
jgi:hypothetical protein